VFKGLCTKDPHKDSHNYQQPVLRLSAENLNLSPIDLSDRKTLLVSLDG